VHPGPFRALGRGQHLRAMHGRVFRVQVRSDDLHRVLGRAVLAAQGGLELPRVPCGDLLRCRGQERMRAVPSGRVCWCACRFLVRGLSCRHVLIHWRVQRLHAMPRWRVHHHGWGARYRMRSVPGWRRCPTRAENVRGVPGWDLLRDVRGPRLPGLSSGNLLWSLGYGVPAVHCRRLRKSKREHGLHSMRPRTPRNRSGQHNMPVLPGRVILRAGRRHRLRALRARQILCRRGLKMRWMRSRHYREPWGRLQGLLGRHVRDGRGNDGVSLVPARQFYQCDGSNGVQPLPPRPDLAGGSQELLQLLHGHILLARDVRMPGLRARQLLHQDRRLESRRVRGMPCRHVPGGWRDFVPAMPSGLLQPHGGQPVHAMQAGFRLAGGLVRRRVCVQGRVRGRHGMPPLPTGPVQPQTGGQRVCPVRPGRVQPGGSSCRLRPLRPRHLRPGGRTQHVHRLPEGGICVAAGLYCMRTVPSGILRA